MEAHSVQATEPLTLGANQERLRREALSVFKLTLDRFAHCIGLRLQSFSTHTPREAIRKKRNDAVRRIMSLRYMHAIKGVVTAKLEWHERQSLHKRKRMVGARVTSSLTFSDLP